jgi:hypothetical protein
MPVAEDGVSGGAGEAECRDGAGLADTIEIPGEALGAGELRAEDDLAR